jgi:HTH-type transcriptional regulator/antitoxin HigA
VDREAWERLWLRPVATFRRSKVFQARPGSTAAWLRIGELEGRARKCDSFDAKTFRGVLNRARALTRRRDDFSQDLIVDCAQAGVALVFEKEIPGCRASGAARWLSPTKALIQLSDRFKREDSFWFSFFHEGAHLLLHSKRDSFVDDDRRGGDIVEEEANRFAADILIPPDRARDLVRLKSNPDVEHFAAAIGIGPAIVVGRLQNDHYWVWNEGRSLIGRLEIAD